MEMQLKELENVFRANLIARRNELGLSQAQLAKKIGANQPYISALEKGERNPTFATIAKISEALSTTPSAMLTPDIFCQVAK